MVLMLALFLLWISAPRITYALTKENECTVEMYINPSANEDANISSPGYPDSLYRPGEGKTWCISAPDDVTISLNCDIFDIPKSDDCLMNALVISSTKDAPRPFCGSKPFRAESSSNDMKVQFYSHKKSRGGKFFCHVNAREPSSVHLRTVVYEDCDCGYSYSLRIVGGEETGINEFPFMAGLVDSRRGAVIVCGATIISHKYVLTAEHCLDALDVSFTGVLVGEHNIDSGSETSVTKLIRVRRFIHYPYYNRQTRQYDIAMMELMKEVTYGLRVGPVCLPFLSRNWDLTGQTVTILGWGTTEFGGPRSKFLRKAYVDIIDITNCMNTYGGDIEANTQMCAYRKNSDACQYDSGGPLVWMNSETGRYELVGIVNYGRSCASADPSVNTKVAPYLQWIIDYAEGATFCYLS